LHNINKYFFDEKIFSKKIFTKETKLWIKVFAYEHNYFSLLYCKQAKVYFQ